MLQLAKVYEATAGCICLELGKQGASYAKSHTRCLELTGHLFDKALFNRILDVLVCVAFTTCQLHCFSDHTPPTLSDNHKIKPNTFI